MISICPRSRQFRHCFSSFEFLSQNNFFKQTLNLLGKRRKNANSYEHIASFLHDLMPMDLQVGFKKFFLSLNPLEKQRKTKKYTNKNHFFFFFFFSWTQYLFLCGTKHRIKKDETMSLQTSVFIIQHAASLQGD